MNAVRIIERVASGVSHEEPQRRPVAFDPIRAAEWRRDARLEWGGKPKQAVWCSVRPDKPFASFVELAEILGCGHNCVSSAVKKGHKVRGYEVKRV